MSILKSILSVSNALVLLLVIGATNARAQRKNTCITAYYAGPARLLDSFETEKLTHIIFSFGHLKGNKLHISNAGDTACIQKMVSLKARNPALKVILSLGGWGGCEKCSPVFSEKSGREEFAASVKALTDYFGTDGIDLDWEYPAIPGHPGHPYARSDKENFSALLKALRRSLGKKKEISFAAGGFNQFIDSAVDWKTAMRFADKVYVMTYDLVHGYSTVSGHHTPLYSTPQQEASADHAVQRMQAAGVPAAKIVIGAAFYARMFYVSDPSKVSDTSDTSTSNGLYLPCRFYRGISYRNLYDSISPERGFTRYWDSTAHAPFAYNPQRRILVTYDDKTSVTLKVKYALQHRLGGIMFWQLAEDRYRDGLLGEIYSAARY